MTALSDAMQTLTAQYYNALTSQIPLDPGQFQLTQGSVALGATSTSLWSILDSIPPASASNLWSPGGQNTYSSQYGALISRLKDSAGSDFMTAMGDWYAAWTGYLARNQPAAGQTLAQFFQAWAFASGMPPQQATQVASLYAAAMNGPIFQANQMYTAAGGQAGVKAYTETIESATAAILSTRGATVTLQTATESSDTSHSWAKGSVEGFFEDFFGGAESGYDAESSAVLASGLEFTISFDHVATIRAQPLSQGSITAGPSAYPAWYVPAALTDGYQNNNNLVWQQGAPGWASFFGPGGSFPRATQAVVLVDGVKIGLTSTKSIATSSRESVKEAFAAGFFPFFGAEAEGGWSTTADFTDEGLLTVTSSSPLGNPQILGVLQSPIEAVAANHALARAILAASAGRAATRPPVSGAVIDPSNLAALVNVSVNWTPGAYAAMVNAHPNPGVQQTVFLNTNTWAMNNAPHWAMGMLYNFLGATAQRVPSPGGGIMAQIVAYV